MHIAFGPSHEMARRAAVEDELPEKGTFHISENYVPQTTRRRSSFDIQPYNIPNRDEYQYFQNQKLPFWRSATFPRYAVGAVVIFGVYYVSHLEEVPISGRRRFINVSPQLEEKLARSEYAELMNEYRDRTLPSWHPVSKMAQKVAHKLIQVTGLKKTLNWEVNVVDAPLVNALVLPGGKIFVFTGILPVVHDEEGLAAVLAHEIGHQVARHSAEKLSKTLVFFLPLTIALDAVLGMGQFSVALLQLAFMLPFSRKLESEADYIGLLLMAQACYDPKAAIDMWRRMSQYQGSKQLSYLSTHPSNDSRIKALTTWMPEAERIQENSDCRQTSHLFSLFSQRTQEAVSCVCTKLEDCLITIMKWKTVCLFLQDHMARACVFACALHPSSDDTELMQAIISSRSQKSTIGRNGMFLVRKIGPRLQIGHNDLSRIQVRVYLNAAKSSMLTVLIKKVAADIDTVFSNQIVGMVPLLKERVVEVVGEERKLAIEEIEAWVDESLENDPPSPPPPVQVATRPLPLVHCSAHVFWRRICDDERRVLDEVFLLPPEMLAKSRYVLDDSPRRYVRTPNFKTNGLVLSLLWIDTTSKPPPPDRKVEDTINLPNIFHNKTLRSTHKDAWIIALDPGATCIVGAVAYDPNHPDQRRNLAVTTKCLAEPERRYRNWLEADKPEAICTAERECTKSDQQTWPVFLERFVISYDIARAYYSTKRYKRKRWDADKAKRGELDRVLEGIVNMVDESMGHKLSGGKKVIVAIGMGDFSSTKSRHVMFISNQIIGMLPLLKERVVEAVGEEGKQAIGEIEAWVDASLEDDSSSPPPQVQVFYKVNRLLPGPYRWSIVPHTSFGDGYVTMSEECLFDLLFDIPSFQKTVREVAGVGPKALKIATRVAFMKNPSKGRLLDEVFLLPPEMLAKSRYVLDDSPRRYVRTPNFKTNGLVLSLLWIDTTSKPPPPHRKVEDTINLSNIFHNKTLRSTHKDAWIIALDPGATCIVGAVAYDPNHVILVRWVRVLSPLFKYNQPYREQDAMDSFRISGINMIPKFDGKVEQYRKWRNAIEDVALANGLGCLVVNEISRGTKYSEADWAAIDLQLKGVIKLSISDEVRYSVEDDYTVSTTRFLNKMDDRFAVSTTSTKLKLLNELLQLKQMDRCIRCDQHVPGHSIESQINQIRYGRAI
ncbi:hypothetical protein SeMB42_g04642 [Synchytrium endobioticum]|uniref:Peptidase M48 domain-containing protein n=1 Tax=Synchytrium endobioticum TaxID=286115 RepID=A0A507CX11_9FUNG|nr:hypothetical protein SeMB42_g04642 [Synchytrium endobioticum]